MKKGIKVLGTALLFALVLMGCTRPVEEESNDNVLSDNIIITETGEVIQKKPEVTEQPIDIEKIGEQVQEQANAVVTPKIQLTEPEQEQIISEEDQIAPAGNALQIVFLGDSIFDFSRDGTGIPYLTGVQCEADVYNLAIGGTSASLEPDDRAENELIVSQSLIGVVKVLEGYTSTSSFTGTRTKDILDNTDINWAETDYFVIEYGLNDFFRAAPLSNLENEYDLYTYAGALRYAVSNLKKVAVDATIILCAPNYAQFFNGSQMIGDGNTLNTGYGTLYDYKGICQYVANERQAVFFDAYLDLGINGYTAEDYLEDGVHLTAEGRQLYADALAKRILSLEETKNN